jgi:hypothetical protein
VSANPKEEAGKASDTTTTTPPRNVLKLGMVARIIVIGFGRHDYFLGLGSDSLVWTPNLRH